MPLKRTLRELIDRAEEAVDAVKMELSRLKDVERMLCSQEALDGGVEIGKALAASGLNSTEPIDGLSNRPNVAARPLAADTRHHEMNRQMVQYFRNIKAVRELTEPFQPADLLAKQIPGIKNGVTASQILYQYRLQGWIEEVGKNHYGILCKRTDKFPKDEIPDFNFVSADA